MALIYDSGSSLASELNEEGTDDSTKARTRLYQMGISNNLEAIEKDFTVYGLKAKKWESFNKKATYEAFLVKRKKT